MKKANCSTLRFNELYFNGDTEQICDWMENNCESFGLNETSSCVFSFAEDMIYIEGDEDWHEITIEEIIPIDLN